MGRQVRPKKHLGQHFLKDESIAQRIANSLTGQGYERVLEIGPGTGVLSQFLLDRTDLRADLIEIDQESFVFLHERWPEHPDRIHYGDFLKMDLEEFSKEPMAVIGNFPYNISSQILFRVHRYRHLIPEVVGMFQKEVAERVVAQPGSKIYGIPSVLLQAFYDTEYLFTVDEHVFNPPPKVKSAVIRLVRKGILELNCDEALFTTVVKTAFNQRRKTLRNALKPLIPKENRFEHPLLSQRAEQLSVADFIALTEMVGNNR